MTLLDDRKTIMAMHSYRRPARSATELAFITRFILPLGVETDSYGNLFKVVGDAAPQVLWSSHTDSVHYGDGMQNVAYDKEKDIIALTKSSKSSCLGADCAAGVWIMSEMIKAGVPGLYVFHRDEEVGHKGASFIAKQTNLLFGIKSAIAFDRKGTDSVITHMAGARTCSDVFGRSLAAQLSGYRLDPRGVWTDTVAYKHSVPECTNISVGYEHAHSSFETQSIAHLVRLRDMMVKIDAAQFVIARDPASTEHLEAGSRRTGLRASARRHGGSRDLFEEPTLVDLVTNNPKQVAAILEDHGISYRHLKAAILLQQSRFASKMGDMADAAAEADEILQWIPPSLVTASGGRIATVPLDAARNDWDPWKTASGTGDDEIDNAILDIAS